MKKFIFQYLLMMGAIAAPTKASEKAPVVPQTPEQLLERALRLLSTIATMILVPIGLTLWTLSMLPPASKPVVLQGALFLAAGFINICDILTAGLLAFLTWVISVDIDTSMIETISNNLVLIVVPIGLSLIFISFFIEETE